MIQILPQEGTLASRIGAGIGRGLADQVPKEIDRSRLASGLKNIMNNPNASPIEVLSNLHTIPGITPQMVEQYYPLINAELVKKRRQDGQQQGSEEQVQPKGQGQQGVSGGQNVLRNPPQNQTQDQQKQKQNENRIGQQGSQQRSVKPVVRKSPEQVIQRQYQLQDELGLDAQTALAQANKEADTEVANAQELRDVKQRENVAETNIQNKLDSRILSKTQMANKESLFKDLTGKTYQKLLKKAEMDVANGLTDTQAAEKYSDRAEDLVKATTSLKNNIGSRPFFGQAGKKLRDDIKKYKKPFEQNDALEDFQAIQRENLDIGDHLSGFSTWEPSKQLEASLNSVKSNDTPENIAKIISPHITDKDSLWSVGYLLNKLGVDDEATINEIMKLNNDGAIKLDSRQQREGGEYYPVHFGLGDALWAAFWDLNPTVALTKYISGNREKVSGVEKIKRYFGKE